MFLGCVLFGCVLCGGGIGLLFVVVCVGVVSGFYIFNELLK